MPLFKSGNDAVTLDGVWWNGANTMIVVPETEDNREYDESADDWELPAGAQEHQKASEHHPRRCGEEKNGPHSNFLGHNHWSDRESDKQRHRDECGDSDTQLGAATELVHMLDRRNGVQPKNFAPVRNEEIEKNRQQNTKHSKPKQPVARLVFMSVSEGGGPKSERDDGDGRDAEQTRHICFFPFRTRAWRRRIWKIKIEQDAAGVPAAHGPQHQGKKEEDHAKRVPLAASSQAFAHDAQNLDALRDACKHKKTDNCNTNTEPARF